MPRHELRADAAVGRHPEWRRPGWRAPRVTSESVATPSTSRSTMRSNWRRRKRARSTAERRAPAIAQEFEQPLGVLLRRQHAVEAAGAGHLQDALRLAHDGVGKKLAVGEQAHRAAQRRGRADDAVERRRGFLAQPLEVQERPYRDRARWPATVECASRCVPEAPRRAAPARTNSPCVRPISPPLQLYRPAARGRARSRWRRSRSCPSAANRGRAPSPAHRRFRS